ncbi:hypothetical protein CLOM_g13471, partial [Closterium sp. NIES-68]
LRAAEDISCSDGLTVKDDTWQALKRLTLGDAAESCPVEVRDGGERGGGRGLFATQPIEKGHVFLTVHRDQMITGDSLPPPLSSLLPPSLSVWARIALFLLLRPSPSPPPTSATSHRHHHNHWQPYIASLPAFKSVDSTVWWQEHERAMLLPSLYNDTRDRTALIQSEFGLIETALADHPHLHAFLPNLTFEQFCHAYSLVCSRAWGIESLGNLALVPYADMINHNPGTHTLLCYDEEQQVVEITADRDYEPGEQVLVSYGDLSNGVLALDFGFTVADNPHDSVEMCVLISSSTTPHNAPLNEAKRCLLVEAQLLPSDTASGASFVLKRIQTPASDGRGLPFALRALARILTASSEEQLQFLRDEGRHHSGTVARRPIRAQGGGGGGERGEEGGGEVAGVEGWEGRAMGLLLSLMEERIEHMMDARQVIKQMAYEVDTSRLGMALQIIDSQLAVLRSVAAWLRPRASGGGLEHVISNPEARNGWSALR